MIRQAISCDVCGAEKRQTNHWFVAWESAGELRVSGWSSRNRLRAGSKHLCGQVCLHKLADDFMARVIAGKVGDRAQTVDEEITAAPACATDASLTSGSGFEEVESSAMLLTPAPIPAAPRTLPRAAAGPMAVPERARPEILPDESPRFASHNWRAQAWERERERAQRTGEHRPEIVARRLSQG